MKEYKMDDKEIEVQYSSSLVPSSFRISLVPNYGENNLIVEFNYKCLSDEDYNDFVNGLKELLERCRLKIDNEEKRASKQQLPISSS